MKLTLTLTLSANLLLSSAFVFAQAPPVSPSQRAPAAANSLPSFHCTMTAGPVISGVTGPVRPYSAVEEVVHTQTLSDGTQTTEKHVTQKFYRNSEGRERIEHPICEEPDEPARYAVVEIHDPTAGYGYILDPDRKIAHRFKSQPIPQASPPPQRRSREVTIVPVPAATSAQAGKTLTFVTEPLGSKMIEGVYVDGTRTSQTIPAGMEGNDRPITIVQDSWISAELGISILNSYLDPRSGETITHLTNLDLSEPSIDLFQIPPDYQLVDESEPVTMKFHRP